jgi:hypothetical protein
MDYTSHFRRAPPRPSALRSTTQKPEPSDVRHPDIGRLYRPQHSLARNHRCHIGVCIVNLALVAFRHLFRRTKRLSDPSGAANIGFDAAPNLGATARRRKL